MEKYRRIGPNLKKKLAKLRKRSGSASPTTATSTCIGFLDLPEELRNRIYRVVLLSSDTIQASKGVFTEPGLLKTCHQIRTELTKIYYCENRWEVDPNYVFLQAFSKHITTRPGINSSTEIEIHLADLPKKGFLDLPGELRNKIYRMALVSNHSILVSKGSFLEPGLLSTCHQIRKETIKIYYCENRWEIDCPDWDYSVRTWFHKHLKTRPGIGSLSNITTYWVNSGSLTNKTNMLKFIKMLHENPKVKSLKYETDTANKDAAATGAFKIAELMDKQPWSIIEQVLEVYFQEVAKEKDGWDWD